MRTKRLSLLLTALLLFLCFLRGVSAGDTGNGVPNETVSAAFGRFCENAAGRYSLSTDNETAVLELIPAFGRLFASAAYYMGGRSLYSYYAAELIPACPTRPDLCGNDSENSFMLGVRSFSNMSYAGNYWPGEAFQRVTPDDPGLVLSGFEGDGDPLLSAEAAQLVRDPSAPSVFVYAPGDGSVPDRFAFDFMLPEHLAGTWRSGDAEGSVSVSFGADKRIMLLSDPAGSPSDVPPELYIGTYSLLKTQADSFVLCYFMSRPDTGAMPYEGCAMLKTGGGELTVSRMEDRDCLLLPGSAEVTVFSR